VNRGRDDEHHTIREIATLHDTARLHETLAGEWEARGNTERSERHRTTAEQARARARSLRQAVGGGSLATERCG
jgi:hypothetical protein